MKRSYSATVVVAAIFQISGCGGEGEARPANGGAGGAGGRGGDGARVTPVEIVLAEAGSIARSTTLASTVEAVRVVSVNAQIAGPLSNVAVREGARVSSEAVLASVSVPELQAQMRSAEAAFDFAKSTAQRSEELFRARIVTATEVERDRAALAAAQATLDALKTRAGFATVRAPMSGVVTERLVETGDIVSPNQRLFTIADISTLVTRVQVSERDVAALRTGAEVGITVDAFPGERFSGRIRRIFPAADSVTRMIPVEVALTGGSAERIRPGFTARVTFQLDVRDDAVLIPARAVTGAAGNQAVMIVKEGKPVRRAVRPGAEVSGRIEILDGLQIGDTVIVVGATGLREGAAIRIVDPLAPDRSGGSAPIQTPARTDSATAAAPGGGGQ